MKTDVVIIGAGVIGIACAAESALQGNATLCIDRHESFGQETSSRNSEVIHSGIYYPTGSLKARLCVAANNNLYRECERAGVWTRRCGKLIVAVSPEEEPALESLYQRGLANGIREISVLDAAQVQRMEPHIRARYAIYLPSTGIIDSHQLMRQTMIEAQVRGADFAFGIEYLGAGPIPGGYRLAMKDTTGERTEIDTAIVVNAGGLWCDRIAHSFGIDIDAAGYRLHHNRGHYYSVSPAKSRLVSHLVYPLPHPQLVGAGIHITIDKAGQLKLGPDTEYLDPSVPESEWYKFDDTRREKFYSAVRRYFPPLELSDLSPNQVGVRPKLVGSENALKDFCIIEESRRGLPGLINLINIESPGLTSSREIARVVTSIISELA